MAQALMRTAYGYDRLLIDVDMLDAMVASGTIEDPNRVELIEGELVPMSPTHLRHARLTSILNWFFRNKVSGDFDVFDGVSVRLNTHNEPIPDVSVARIGVTTNVLMPSDCALLIEVADATANKDRNLKAPLYAKAGISELWIIDLNTQETIVHRRPNELGWSETFSVAFTDAIIPLFDNNISVVVADL